MTMYFARFKVEDAYLELVKKCLERIHAAYKLITSDEIPGGNLIIFRFENAQRQTTILNNVPNKVPTFSFSSTCWT